MKKESKLAKITSNRRPKGQLVVQNFRANSGPRAKKGMAKTKQKERMITILKRIKIDLNFNGILLYNCRK
jgi:hypothetical protein